MLFCSFSIFWEDHFFELLDQPRRLRRQEDEAAGADDPVRQREVQRDGHVRLRGHGHRVEGRGGPEVGSDLRVSKIGKITSSKICKFLARSFSTVSKRNFARKYTFDSVFQALQDLHTSAPLQSQNFRKKSV